MTPSRRKIYRTAVAAGLLVGLAGCASIPPPTDQINTANATISAAATPDGQHYAGEELATARSELAGAQAAVARQDYDQASRLAAMAQADADLARAKSRALAAQSAVVAKTEDNDTLKRRLLDQEPLK
jgi:hypothetical protein